MGRGVDGGSEGRCVPAVPGGCRAAHDLGRAGPAPSRRVIPDRRLRRRRAPRPLGEPVARHRFLPPQLRFPVEFHGVVGRRRDRAGPDGGAVGKGRRRRPGGGRGPPRQRLVPQRLPAPGRAAGADGGADGLGSAGQTRPRTVTPASDVPTDTKSARTRSAIIDAALRLFRERGYDATTMRAIAAEAGVSVGNAYYYFESKEHLVQGFYDRAQIDHAAAARPVLDAETDLTTRIVGVGEAWLEVMEPYRPFAGKFFKNAADPTSPLSPFSAESTPAPVAAHPLWHEL